MQTHGSHRPADELPARHLTGRRDFTSFARHPESNKAATTTTAEQWMAVMGIARPNAKPLTGCRKEETSAIDARDLPPSGKKRRRNEPSHIKRTRHHQEGPPKAVEPEEAKSMLGHAAFEQARDRLILQQQEFRDQTLELHRICEAQRQLAERMTSSERRSPSSSPDDSATTPVPFLSMTGASNCLDRMSHGSGGSSGEASSHFRDALLVAAPSNAHRTNKSSSDSDRTLNSSGAGSPHLTVQDVISAKSVDKADEQVTSDGCQDVSSITAPTKYEDVVLHQQRLLEHFQKQMAHQGPPSEVPTFQPIVPAATFQQGLAPPWSAKPVTFQGGSARSGFIVDAASAVSTASRASPIPAQQLSHGDLRNCSSASLEERLEKHRAHMTKILDGISHGPSALQNSTDSSAEERPKQHRADPRHVSSSRETAAAFLMAASGTPPWPSPSPSPTPTSGQVIKPKAIKAHGRSAW